MDEKVIVNLGFFLLPLPSPALTIPSPALIIPFSDNKLANKLAPHAPSNILKILLFVLWFHFQSFYLLLLIKYRNFLKLQ